MRSRTLALRAAIAFVALTGLSAPANAITVRFDPAGNVAADSIGGVQFSSETLTISCQMELWRTLAAATEGEATERPDVDSNPNVGEIYTGSAHSCTLGFSVRVLFRPERPDWDLYWYNFLGGSLMYILHVQILVQDIFGLVSCLIDARVMVGYDEDTGVAGLESIAPLGAMVGLQAGGNGCPDTVQVRGLFTLQPRQLVEIT